MSDTVKSNVSRDGDGWTITATLPSGEQWSTRAVVSDNTASMLASELSAAVTLYLDRAQMLATLERIYRTHGPMVFEEYRSGFSMNVITAYEVHSDDLLPDSARAWAPLRAGGGSRRGRQIVASHDRTWAGAARKMEDDFSTFQPAGRR